jgi:ribonuclease Z
MTVRDLTILGCSSQQPTRKRNHGAYLLRWNEEGLLFDPGEGTQRQFIFANVAPPCVNRIFISHFHGDHCLGLGSMLMRLNLDKVAHPIHCYYPASGKKYFDRLRYGTIYHETLQVIEHPIDREGIIDLDDKFQIEAYPLKHGVDNLGYRITERDVRKFDRKKLEAFGVRGPLVGELEKNGGILIGEKTVLLDQVSSIRKGDAFAIVIDTLPCENIFKVADGAQLLLCEATYLEGEKALAKKHRHLTARQAAQIAKKAGVHQLILTHFSARYLDLGEFLEEARPIFPNTDVAEDLKRFEFTKS